MESYLETDHLSAVAQAEQEAYKLFRETYQLRVPPPARPKAIDITSVGFMFWFYLLQSVAAITLGATRTASMFYLVAAESGSVLLAWLEAGSAVFAIEGGIVVYAAARAIHERKTSERTLIVALIFMALISAIAGLGQSISVVENIDPTALQFFQYLLAITLGLGSSVVVYVSGDVLGGQIAIVLASYQTELGTFKNDTSQYIEAMNTAWHKSDERKIARGELKVLRGAPIHRPSQVSQTSQVRRDMGRKYAYDDQVVQNTTLTGGRMTRNKVEIYTYLDTVLAENKKVPSVAETVQALGLSKSTVSRVRLDWLRTNGINQE